jgi:hypothetical protein
LDLALFVDAEHEGPIRRIQIESNLARSGTERREQRQRSMAVVLEPVALGAPRRQGHHRVEAVQGLKGQRTCRRASPLAPRCTDPLSVTQKTRRGDR